MKRICFWPVDLMFKTGDPQIDSLIRFGLALAIFAIVDLLTKGVLGYIFLWLALLAPLIFLLPLAKFANLFGGNITQALPQWVFGIGDTPKAFIFAVLLLGISILLKTSNSIYWRMLSLVLWFHALLIGMVLLSIAIGGQEGMGR